MRRELREGILMSPQVVLQVVAQFCLLYRSSGFVISRRQPSLRSIENISRSLHPLHPRARRTFKAALKSFMTLPLSSSEWRRCLLSKHDKRHELGVSGGKRKSESENVRRWKNFPLPSHLAPLRENEKGNKRNFPFERGCRQAKEGRRRQKNGFSFFQFNFISLYQLGWGEVGKLLFHSPRLAFTGCTCDAGLRSARSRLRHSLLCACLWLLKVTTSLHISAVRVSLFFFCFPCRRILSMADETNFSTTFATSPLPPPSRWKAIKSEEVVLGTLREECSSCPPSVDGGARVNRAL